MVQRVAARYAASLVTPEYVGALLKGLSQGDAPEAYRQLQGLERSLRNEAVAPFPVSEVVAYLEDRGVPGDELELVRRVKVRAPRAKPTGVTFTDAFLAFGHEVGVSIVPDMRFEDDPRAGAAVLGWLGGFKKLRGLARQVWDKAVKKVHLGRPTGSEDASWRSGGVLDLDVTRAGDPKVRASQLTHELGHAFEELHRLGGEAPWGEPPFVSDYAEFKPGVEDVAESFRAYIEEPSVLRSKCPAKYEAIKRLV